jgi:hypothetical protein
MERSRRLLTTRAAFERPVFPGKTVRVIARGDAVLRACEGELWVTWEARLDAAQSHLRDHIVAAGQSLLLRDGEVVVVGASDARHGLAFFDVEPAPARRRPAVPRWTVANLLAALWRRGSMGGLLAA